MKKLNEKTMKHEINLHDGKKTESPVTYDGFANKPIHFAYIVLYEFM